MNLSFVYHVLGAAVCVAISYGVNRYQRPTFDASYPPQLYTEQRGSLQLNYHGQTLELPVMTSQVVAYDVARAGRSYKLRELTIRATAPRDQQARLELYVDLSHVLGGVSPGAGDPQSLKQSELPVARSGRFGARRSFVVIDGQPRNVISGNLLLTEVEPTEARDPPRYRATGRLELQLDGAAGVELITGRLLGLLAWDAAPSAK